MTKSKKGYGYAQHPGITTYSDYRKSIGYHPLTLAERLYLYRIKNRFKKHTTDTIKTIEEMADDIYDCINEKINNNNSKNNHSQIKPVDWETIKFWLADPNRSIPKQWESLILEHYNLSTDIVDIQREEEMYFRLTHENGDPDLPLHKRMSKQEIENRINNSKYNSCLPISDDLYDKMEQDTRNFELENIKKLFVTLNFSQKYKLKNNFHLYVEIPYYAWEFTKLYATLSTDGRNLMQNRIKHMVDSPKNKPLHLSNEQSLLLDNLIKLKNQNLTEKITVEENKLQNEFFNILQNNFHFNEHYFYENMQYYPELEPDEIDILIYFIKLGDFFDPDCYQLLSVNQKKLSDLIIDLCNEQPAQ